MKYLLLAIAALTIVGCAKPNQPAPEPIVIPVQLVNVQTVDISVPELPSDKRLVKISKNDPADEALEEVLDYTVDLKEVTVYALEELKECKAEIDERNERLEKIKQYILLNQAQVNKLQSLQ